MRLLACPAPANVASLSRYSLHNFFTLLKEVKIFDKTSYSLEDMDLDPSQFEAFYSALTNDFTVIQGPPGTGKSHIGLRMVQALLANRTFWQAKRDTGGCSSSSKSTETPVCPILVLAYKNHALDQFLCGVLKVSLYILETTFRFWFSLIIIRRFNSLFLSYSSSANKWCASAEKQTHPNFRRCRWQRSAKTFAGLEIQTTRPQRIRTSDFSESTWEA